MEAKWQVEEEELREARLIRGGEFDAEITDLWDEIVQLKDQMGKKQMKSLCAQCNWGTGNHNGCESPAKRGYREIRLRKCKDFQKVKLK